MLEKLYSIPIKPKECPIETIEMEVEFINRYTRMVKTKNKNFVMTKANNQVFVDQLEEEMELDSPVKKQRHIYNGFAVDVYGNSDYILVLRTNSNTQLRQKEITIGKKIKKGREIDEYDIWKKHKKGDVK